MLGFRWFRILVGGLSTKHCTCRTGMTTITTTTTIGTTLVVEAVSKCTNNSPVSLPAYLPPLTLHFLSLVLASCFVRSFFLAFSLWLSYRPFASSLPRASPAQSSGTAGTENAEISANQYTPKGRANIFARSAVRRSQPVVPC